MFTATDFGQDATAGALTLKPFESTFQRLVFTYANFQIFPLPSPLQHSGCATGKVEIKHVSLYWNGPGKSTKTCKKPRRHPTYRISSPPKITLPVKVNVAVGSKGLPLMVEPPNMAVTWLSTRKCLGINRA